MKRIPVPLLMGLTCAAAFSNVAPAQAYQFTFVTPIPHERQVERALSYQVNLQVAKHWKIDPVSFTSPSTNIGIPISVEPDVHQACGYTTAQLKTFALGGCHYWQAIWVKDASFSQLTYEISHEVVETEVDPMDQTTVAGWDGTEPCDPVTGFGYKLWGINVADFVFPRWFAGDAKGPWDQMKYETSPANPAGGDEVG